MEPDGAGRRRTEPDRNQRGEEKERKGARRGPAEPDEKMEEDKGRGGRTTGREEEPDGGCPTESQRAPREPPREPNGKPDENPREPLEILSEPRGRPSESATGGPMKAS